MDQLIRIHTIQGKQYHCPFQGVSVPRTQYHKTHCTCICTVLMTRQDIYVIIRLLVYTHPDSLYALCV